MELFCSCLLLWLEKSILWDIMYRFILSSLYSFGSMLG